MSISCWQEAFVCHRPTFFGVFQVIMSTMLQVQCGANNKPRLTVAISECGEM